MQHLGVGEWRVSGGEEEGTGGIFGSTKHRRVMMSQTCSAVGSLIGTGGRQKHSVYACVRLCCKEKRSRGVGTVFPADVCVCL